jgi:hypothetical protein
VQQAENSVCCEIEDRTVLLNVAAGKYHGFNEVATRIWQLISAPRTVNSICDELMSEFDISQEQCEAEVVEFLQKLKAAELITIS